MQNFAPTDSGATQVVTKNLGPFARHPHTYLLANERTLFFIRIAINNIGAQRY